MISLPSQPKIIEQKGNRAVFEIDSLYPGYGVTIGNALRRALFSSLTGAAVTKAKIKGVQHEFSTISGILEDVITIALNLKQLRFKVFSDEPQQATLKIKGIKEVAASDFHLPSQVELVNKNEHVASLTSKSAELDLEIQIEKGIGYSPAESRKKEKLAIGEIALDAIFTPIKKVSYKVENMRVGERTDFDRLQLEIETDGTIDPQAALFQAAQTLSEHFFIIIDGTKQDEPKRKEPKERESEEDVLKKDVKELKFSTRTGNALASNNIKTVGGILKKSEESLLALEGMGEKAVQEIKKKLKKFGLELK